MLLSVKITETFANICGVSYKYFMGFLANICGFPNFHRFTKNVKHLTVVQGDGGVVRRLKLAVSLDQSRHGLLAELLTGVLRVWGFCGVRSLPTICRRSCESHVTW